MDALIVGTTSTQDSSEAITYDSWSGATSSAASGGGYRFTSKKNSNATIDFTGTGISWITATGPGDGMALVTIDGVTKGKVDLYAPASHWQVVEGYPGLASGAHIFQITALGAKNASSTGANVAVDAFVVSS